MDLPVRLGMIGCGAVTEYSYLPAIRGMEGIEIVALVDKDIKRSSRLAKEFNIKQVALDYQDIAGSVDAVIIALPNQLHKESATFFLRNRIHVLVEKPMAITPEDCDLMIQEAERNGVKLAVGHVRRFFNNSIMIKQIVDEGWIGEVKKFILKEGGVYNWPTASGFYFNPAIAGGGVLMDTGPHLLDLMLWWFGEPEDVEYEDDNFGGTEASCVLKVTMQEGTQGILKMTRLVPIESMFMIEGTKGFVRTRPFDFDSVQIFLRGVGEYELKARSRTSILHYFQLQVASFMECIMKDVKPAVGGREGRRVVELIQKCYAQGHLFDARWLSRS